MNRLRHLRILDDLRVQFVDQGLLLNARRECLMLRGGCCRQSPDRYSSSPTHFLGSPSSLAQQLPDHILHSVGPHLVPAHT